MQNILVISNRTCECPVVIDEIERHAREAEQATVVLVAPAVNSRLKHFTSDTDAALADAQLRVDTAQAELASRGVLVTASVGDANPLQAIEDALATFRAHAMIIATHPPEASHWLEKRLIDTARERFGLPVTHLVSRAGMPVARLA